MRRYKGLYITIAVIAGLTACPVFSADTWRLGEEGQWKAVSGEDKYLLAVAEIKNLINMGETAAVGKAVDKLKKDFPEVAGPDLDAFMKAEMLFCEGKYTRAVRSYDKFLADFPKSPLYEAALDRKFAIATAFLGGQKKRVFGVFMMSRYDEGIKVMERISDQTGDAPIAKRAAIAIAQSYEKREKYNDAYHKWSEISTRWPGGQIGEDALLNMARCKHAAYRGPKYDVSNLVSAKSYYATYKLRYPESAKALDVDKILKQIEEQLAYKEFTIGEYYQKTANKQSAALYYDMVASSWPGSTAAKMTQMKTSEKSADEGSQGKKGKKWKENIKKKLGKLFL
ncbi:MAG: outer membrane protein assembly factor BamD [Sedimentisphaerales bacterium]|nr:outer membrane protein assembly factor BamD [Sedimentisphaerales bacterium]